jgi:hypothetical protein
VVRARAKTRKPQPIVSVMAVGFADAGDAFCGTAAIHRYGAYGRTKIAVGSGTVWRIPSKIDLEPIELQTDSNLGENDIKQLEGDYHRS